MGRQLIHDLGSGSSNDLGSVEQFRPRTLARRLTGFLPREIKAIDAKIPLESRELWKRHEVKKFTDKDGFQAKFIQHVETTLARSLYNCDELAAYEAMSEAVRDNLVIDWNKTQQRVTARDPKRIYYLSLEFLMGRALDNALINLNTDDCDDPTSREMVEGALKQLGFRMEDVLEQEPDAGLGNGGLGRLAACFMDSLATGDYPAWGYGLRYQYGIFAQKIIDGHQVETPDYWLNIRNPWEIERSEIQVPVSYYGHVERPQGASTLSPCDWIGGEQVLAVPYDMPVPGFKTSTVNNLRMWSAKPTTEFDFSKFNAGDYSNSVADQQRAESITAVLYPNDNFRSGKELRLKQQYFWCCASLHDIVRRFKKSSGDWTNFPDRVAIQLNDTHPTLAILELQRILVDLERLDWHAAWSIVTRTFSYTNHTVMQEALEKWPVSLFGHLLPRHLEIVYDINWFFLKDVERKFPRDLELLSRVSIIEDGQESQIRMAYIAVVGSHKVNGVAELHSELIKTNLFQDFVDIYGLGKFTNVTNGITPRRWLKQANPRLAQLIAEKLNDPQDQYLLDMSRLTELATFADDPIFQQQWEEVKLYNKMRLADLLHRLNDGVDVIDRDYLNETLFDIQVKRIHEYKRQQLNIFGVIHRYLSMKDMLSNGAPFVKVANKFPRKVSIFGGKAAPGYFMAKLIIRLINAVADVINNDPDIEDLLKVVFIPDYNVSKAEVIIPACDISEHISTAGTEASGTSNMKFVMNGGLIIGTVDGANVEITREIGEENIFLFGTLAEHVEELRFKHRFHNKPLPSSLTKVFAALEAGVFSTENNAEFQPLVDATRRHGDHYLVSDDFDSYIAAQSLVDRCFHRDRSSWLRKSILSVANVGYFSSDRCVEEYAETIWNVEPVKKD
ncbi:HGL158Cp [Eremothecium sinecaudum]|uniref:Alpha-1,4 glucan phosphorylase n=1 Tax=Eremothecium sinecaudum TaxID=45286 RepID=A0A0X8HVE4_9SACH|nr:HGL158Cp [Eremothecium sinecaudum]AMD22182.1 HGL158Cp [Eremothecium sinecaudum]